MKLLFKQHANICLNFKEKAYSLSDKEFADIYEKTAVMPFDRETDMAPPAVKKIQGSIKGKTVLDIGCGRGYMVNLLSTKYQVTGLDVYINPKLVKKYPKVNFVLKTRIFDERLLNTYCSMHTVNY